MLDCVTKSTDNCQVRALIEWSQPRDSAIVFGAVFVVLTSLRYVSAISVFGNLSLALLSTTMAIRIYRSVLAAINKTNEGNPFKVGKINF